MKMVIKTTCESFKVLAEASPDHQSVHVYVQSFMHVEHIKIFANTDKCTSMKHFIYNFTLSFALSCDSVNE